MTRMVLALAVMVAFTISVRGEDDALVTTVGKGVGAATEEALKDSFHDAVAIGLSEGI